ncbi:hypothetical protein N656DRAFT_719891 [Canariomyces notabilis]|uniref:Uncharacterized protein n=1 Tax=Canariomyces notabilis TaxID=2074819 RepID=A0AAN6QEZ3_9PEZI|nr:hypothetical protein N656DRAFT_719891 [Canariomyces arenarius]
MPSFDRIYASSPVLAMPPQVAHQVPLGKSFQQHQAMSLSQPVSWPAHLVRSSSVAGRKRSRDEASVNLDPPEKLVEAPVIKEPEDEWIYGPGMTLIKKSTGYIADASSQSGTWVEERAAKEEARKAEAALLAQQQLAQSRPSLRSHKSQRLDMTTAANTDGRSPSRRSSPTREATNPLSASSDSIAQPIVDEFTLHLGVGWSRISEHIEAAARGWARYIENHYPVTNVKILLESRGLQSYLVEANEGYFLFAENLRQGRLLSRTPERALSNLKSSPPVFDGLDTMDASESPKPLDSTPGVFAHTNPLASVEMDMS